MSNSLPINVISNSAYDIIEQAEMLYIASLDLAQQLEIEIPKDKMSETLIEYMEKVLTLTDEGYHE